MSSKTKKEKKEKTLKITVLGDKNCGKSTFISLFTSSTQNSTDQPYDVTEATILKDFPSFRLKVIVSECSNDESVIKEIKSSQTVIIIYLMDKRNSFKNLLNKWFKLLRDTIRYEGNILILGNYFNSDIELSSTIEEVELAIKVCQIKAKVIEIGNKDKKAQIKILDDLINGIYLDIEKGIIKLNGDNCNIF